jgi:hypothetical protein
MNKIRQGVIVAAVAAFSLTNASAADSDFTVTVGLKAWNNNWSSWNPVFENTSPPNAIVQNFEQNATSLIPSLSVRYKDFLLGGSYFAKRSYSFGTQGGNFGDVPRLEYDLSAGYYVLPTLAIIGGYKRVEQEFANGTYKFSGPIVGISASAPLTGGFSLYGTAALGPMDLKEPNGVKRDADYRLGEVGLAYAFDAGGAGMKAVIGTIGYRSQAIITKLGGSRDGMKGRDTTEGLTIGIAAAF